jgi:hypothetical protein
MVGAEQSSEEAAVDPCMGEAKCWWPHLVMSRHKDKEASPHGTAVTGGVRSPSGHRTRCRARASDRHELLRGGCG